MHATNCRCPACAAAGHSMIRPQPLRYGAGGPAATRAPASGTPAATRVPDAPVNTSGRWVRRGRTIIILDV
ncbi:MAG: hypothetical protein ACREYA_00500 [Cupriavidus necator]